MQRSWCRFRTLFIFGVNFIWSRNTIRQFVHNSRWGRSLRRHKLDSCLANRYGLPLQGIASINKADTLATKSFSSDRTFQKLVRLVDLLKFHQWRIWSFLRAKKWLREHIFQNEFMITGSSDYTQSDFAFELSFSQ